MNTMRTMAAATAILALAGCGAAHKSAARIPVPSMSAPALVQPLAATGHYPDGVTVRLTGFGRGTSGETASPPDTAYVAFTVTVVNGSDGPVEAEWLTAECTAGGRPADRIFGGDFDLPGGVMRPGDVYVLRAACAVPAGVHTLRVSVSPDFGHDGSLFSGNVT